MHCHYYVLSEIWFVNVQFIEQFATCCINAVDEVTQYEVVLSCRRINEQFLIPILTEILEIFPFNISGFHADNGSEYINQQVANCSINCTLTNQISLKT
jgi:hypothetical protein